MDIRDGEDTKNDGQVSFALVERMRTVYLGGKEGGIVVLVEQMKKGGTRDGGDK